MNNALNTNNAQTSLTSSFQNIPTNMPNLTQEPQNLANNETYLNNAPNNSNLHYSTGNIQQQQQSTNQIQTNRSHLVPSKSIEEIDSDGNNNNNSNMQLITEIKQQNQQQKIQYQNQQNQQYQQIQTQLQQQPQHRSQFQITSISRQQSLSGNSTSIKESKESRFKIVKTDSDKKNDQNQSRLSSSSSSNQQTNSNSNKNDANLNQTPSLPSRQNFNDESGQNGKSYHRGRWHVMDFENATPEPKNQQYSVPVALQQNNYSNSAKNANLAKQPLGQTTPKMTNLRNNINFSSIEAKNDDSNNYQTVNKTEKYPVNNTYDQQHNSNIRQQQMQSQQHLNQQQQQQQSAHFNPITNSNSQQTAHQQQPSGSNIIINPKPIIPATNSTINTQNTNTIPNGQYQTPQLQQQKQQQPIQINMNVHPDSNSSQSSVQASLGHLTNSLAQLNQTQTQENTQQQQQLSKNPVNVGNQSRSNSIPNGTLNLSQPYQVKTQQQQMQNSDQTDSVNKNYNKQQPHIFKEEIQNSPTINQNGIFAHPSMTSSLPPSAAKLLGLQQAQISNSHNNLDLINNQSNSTTNLTNYNDNDQQQHQQQQQPHQKSSDPTVSTNLTYTAQQNSPKEQQQLQQQQQHILQQQSIQQQSNNLGKNLTNSTINLASSTNNVTHAGLTGSATSSTSTILDQTTVAIGDLMVETENDNESEKKSDDKGIKSRIELAMDLVKAHLTSAVNQEISILKNQIKQLTEKCSRLDQDNQILKKHALPETLALIESRNIGREGSNVSSAPNQSSSSSSNANIVNTVNSNQSIASNGQHTASNKLTSDVRLQSNSISNLESNPMVTSATKLVDQQQQKPQQTTHLVEKPHDPMASSFTDQINENSNLFSTSTTTLENQQSYPLNLQHTDTAQSSSNIQMTDNNMYNISDPSSK